MNLLAYADDLLLLAKDEASLRMLLDTCVEAVNWCGLVFKPEKCFTLHIDRKHNKKQHVLPRYFKSRKQTLARLN